jgi:Transketolase, C-terminal subunit
VGFVPGFLSDANGPTHQAIEDVSLMRGIPGVNVWAPAGQEDLLIGLKTILSDDQPWYIRYIHHNSDFAHSNTFEPGKAEIITEGTDVTLLTYGLLFKQTLEAQRLLSDAGYSVGLVNLRTLKPLDEETVLRVCNQSQLVATVEDHFQVGGLYSIIAELLLANRQTANVLPLALDSWYRPTLLQQVLEVEGFTGEKIAERIQRALADQSVGA